MQLVSNVTKKVIQPGDMLVLDGKQVQVSCFSFPFLTTEGKVMVTNPAGHRLEFPAATFNASWEPINTPVH